MRDIIGDNRCDISSGACFKPRCTATTLVTLGLGIGANCAIFSVIEGVLLKPLPFPQPDRLVGVWQTTPGVNVINLNESEADYFTYHDESTVFEDVSARDSCSASVTGLAEPERVACLTVTHRTLPMLGIQPALGRGFTEQNEAPGGADVVLLSYGYWQRRFGEDPSAIGRRIMADGKAREVIGVLPREFWFMDQKPDLVMPVTLDRAKTTVGHYNFQAIARLKPGVTLAQTNADVARMISIEPREFPLPPGFSLKMFQEATIGPSVRPLKQDVVGDIGKTLWVLMATIGMVLLIACANVANLLLVRAEGRQQELAIRTALGAGWGRIAKELLVEAFRSGAVAAQDHCRGIACLRHVVLRKGHRQMRTTAAAAPPQYSRAKFRDHGHGPQSVAWRWDWPQPPEYRA